LDGLLAIPGVRETVPRDGKVAGSCHVLFGGLASEEILLLLDAEGVCASAGSACASGAIEPSHVLVAMGLSPAEAGSGIRFSLGYETSVGDVEVAIAAAGLAASKLPPG
ncbi:MAG TPA: aminotransferase class V-fold PLP-dependent enzyme, partial [Acidimicrobiales bacterium]|nr:aminotransferase class V-fold PLP-dependent enzyme [Acidimicrobiales bacterium]